MRRPKPRNLAPDWLFSYSGVMLLTGILVNWRAGFTQFAHSLTLPSRVGFTQFAHSLTLPSRVGFTQFAHSLTLPSMEVDLDLSHTKAGFVITLTAMVRMASTLIAGTLAPRYGSRFIIGVGTIGAGGAIILLGFAQVYPLVLLAAGLMGVGTGMALTPMMGLLSRWFRQQDRGLATGLAATGGSFAFIFAGVIVPWLVGRDPDDGWRHAWFVFGGLGIGIGAVSLLFLRERPPAGLGSSQSASQSSGHGQGAWPIAAYKNPMIWLATFLAFNSGWSQNIFTSFFGVYLSQENGISLTTAGRLVVLIGVLSVTSGVLWGRMSDQVSRSSAFFYSFLLQGVAFVLMAAFRAWPALSSPRFCWESHCGPPTPSVPLRPETTCLSSSRRLPSG